MNISPSFNLRRLVFFILALALLLSLTGCKQAKQPAVENVDVPESTSGSDILTDPSSAPTETGPEAQVAATMGTITTDKLYIRKDAGSDYEAVDHYVKGDRVEILETRTIDDTTWGRTSKGWIGMGYVKMDGTPAPSNEDTTDSTETDIVSNGSLTVLGYGVVDLKELNVRSGPGTNYAKISEVFQGIRYAYYQESSDWVRIDEGWVSTSYFYIEGTTADDAADGTVLTNDLNIRTGPDTDFQSIGTYNKGDEIEILAQVNGWGYTEEGWVSMMYVKLAEPVYTTGTATVTTGLNIRKEADANSEKVDTYKEGDRITILEVKDGWGRTDKGWINLKYVKYE